MKTSSSNLEEHAWKISKKKIFQLLKLITIFEENFA